MHTDGGAHLATHCPQCEADWEFEAMASFVFKKNMSFVQQAHLVPCTWCAGTAWLGLHTQTCRATNASNPHYVWLSTAELLGVDKDGLFKALSTRTRQTPEGPIVSPLDVKVRTPAARVSWVHGLLTQQSPLATRR